MGANFPIDIGTFPIYRGDAAGRNKVTILLEDSDGVPVDLTAFGPTWASQARDPYGVKIDLDVDVANVASGVLELRVPDNKSADLADGYDFDVQATNGTISPITVFKGRLITDGEVTT